jgi:hypothetical protein
MYLSKSVNQIMPESNDSHTLLFIEEKWLVEEKLPIVDKIDIAGRQEIKVI